MEKQIKIAAKLYQCRDAAKTLCGTNYSARIEEYKTVIKVRMARYKLSEMEAAVAIGTEWDAQGRSSFENIKLMAALVEMIEPSETIKP